MLLELDFSDAIPVYRQIRNQIVRAIAEGGLAPGERLPTVRALASECGINVMTASKAYQLLKQEQEREAEEAAAADAAVQDEAEAAADGGEATQAETETEITADPDKKTVWKKEH